eukprot:6182379-Prymnesium_polylepis.1
MTAAYRNVLATHHRTRVWHHHIHDRHWRVPEGSRPANAVSTAIPAARAVVLVVGGHFKCHNRLVGRRGVPRGWQPRRVVAGAQI